MRGPKITLKFNEVRKAVILIIMVYDIERMQVNISKGKEPGDIRQGLPSVLSQGSRTDRRNSPSKDM